MRKTFMFSCFILSLIPGGLCVQTSCLVKDGVPMASVVLSPQAGLVERHAAEELVRFVKRITGAELPIGTAPTEGLLPVRIGFAGAAGMLSSPALERLSGRIRNDGFAVHADGGGVRLFAKVDRGILYGVYHVLRKYGQVYFLYPGEEGEVVPRSPDFVLAQGGEVCNPDFTYRCFNLNGGSGWTPETFDWLVRNGLLLISGLLDFKHPDRHAIFLLERAPVFMEGGHSMGTLVVGQTRSNKEYHARTAELMRDHPEYFGLVDGRRLPAGNFGGCSQPCTSNPATLERMAANCLERIRLYGDHDNYRDFCNDDHTVWCQCENCRAQDCPRETSGFNRRSTRWWHFMNRMAHEILDSGKCPHTTVTSLAYQNFRMPPLGIRPDPRVLVGIAPHQRCYLHSLDDPDCPVNADRFRELFESWHRVGSKAFTFEYHPEMPGRTNYLFNEEAWVKDLKYYSRLDMAGYGMVTNAPKAAYDHYRNTPYQYNCRNRWMSSWQRHWLTGFFSWNIDADYRTVSERINQLYYGRTWPVMREYRRLLTDAILDSRLHMGYGTPNSVLGKCYDRPGVPEKARSFLDQAEKLAAGDPVLLKRLAWDREYFKVNWEAAYHEYAATRQKEYNARRRTGQVVVDGRLDETDWKEADFVSDFKKSTGGGASEEKADPPTFVRMLYDDGNVYFGVEAMKAKGGVPPVLPKADGLEALEGSHLEIFLTPPELGVYYYHLGFGVNGRLYQALTSTGSTRDESVKVDPEYRIRELPDRWLLEVRVPLRNLKVKVRDGMVWRVNVARSTMVEPGRRQLSSWSAGGVFHGSEVHRTVAFGRRGAVLRNGDLEDTVPAEAYRIKDPERKVWKYLSEQVPAHWSFNENNTGVMELRTDSPASGRNYMRVTGVNAFVGQRLNLPDQQVRPYALSAQVRGKGEVLLRLYSHGRYFSGRQSQEAFDTRGSWLTLTHEISGASPKDMYFYMRITGTVDIDDLRILPMPTEEESMPTAEKHP